MRSRFLDAQLERDDRSLKHLTAEPRDGHFKKGPDNGRAALANPQFNCILAVLTAGLTATEYPGS